MDTPGAVAWRAFFFAQVDAAVDVDDVAVGELEGLELRGEHFLDHVIVVILRPAVFNVDDRLGEVGHDLRIHGAAELIEESLRRLANAVECHAIDHTHSDISGQDATNSQSCILADNCKLLALLGANFQPRPNLRRLLHVPHATMPVLRVHFIVVKTYVHHLGRHGALRKHLHVCLLQQLRVHLSDQLDRVLNGVFRQKPRPYSAR